jgi:hypothetical protein
MEGRLDPIAYGPGQGSTGPFAEGVGADRVAGDDPYARLKGMDEEGVDVAILLGSSFRSGVCGLMDAAVQTAVIIDTQICTLIISPLKLERIRSLS